jgi:hypothetical protein
MVLVALLAAPRVVAAQPRNREDRAARDDVEAQHNQGNRLRQQGRNAEARDLFRALYERTREPRAIIRQGLAEMALEEWLAADEHLRAGLAASNDPFVMENRARIEEQLRTVDAHVGSLVLECSPTGATVYVNGAMRGTCPLTAPIRLLPGEVRVRVEQPGATSLEERSTIVPGSEPTVLRIHLRPIVQTPLGGRSNDEARASNRRRAVMLGLGGAGLGLGAVGIGVGLAGLLVTDDRGDPLSEPMGIAGLVAGGVLAVTGVVLLVAAPAHRPETVARGFPVCAPVLGGSGVACTVTF